MNELIKEKDYTPLMNSSIKNLFYDALKLSLSDPLFALWIARMLFIQYKRDSVRKEILKNEGITVPPFMIISITKRCNLKCAGCYSNEFRKENTKEMTSAELKNVISEATELGVSIFLIAGGEPFVKEDLLDILSGFKNETFIIFTNGTMIGDREIAKMKKQRNIIPIISIEGFGSETDKRRGEGTFEMFLNIGRRLKKHNIFYGVSLTMTSRNFDTITGAEFVNEMKKNGTKLFFYVEYVPVTKGSESLVVSNEQRRKLNEMLGIYRKKYESLFIAFPGDEEKFGGCLSSGRGFIHLAPNGDLEPCPFAPFSDTNVLKTSLKDALKSQFLKSLRDNHHELEETENGCALWNKKDWMMNILKNE